MNRLMQIADELAELARARFELRRSVSQIEKDIAAREVAIIPEGGWPGSNADTRKANEKAAKAVDADLDYLAQQLDARKYDLELSELDRDALVGERDAITWTVRDIENVCRGGESVFALLTKSALRTDEMEF